jgi:hypothetical protein
MRTRYADPAFLTRFAGLGASTVTDEEWSALAGRIAHSGMLRNSSTVALPPSGHLAMVSVIQSCVDEAVAKTVNLPATATPADIYDVFQAATGTSTPLTSVCVRPSTVSQRRPACWQAAGERAGAGARGARRPAGR